MRSPKTKEFWVGIFFIIGLISLFFISFKLSPIKDRFGYNSYTLYAYFEHIGGLKERSAVKIAGVTVGRVETIELDINRLKPIVKFTINNKYNRIPINSMLQIKTDGLLGDQFLELIPGVNTNLTILHDSNHHQSQTLPRQRYLQDQDIIYYTSLPPDLESLINKFMTYVADNEISDYQVKMSKETHADNKEQDKVSEQEELLFPRLPLISSHGLIKQQCAPLMMEITPNGCFYNGQSNSILFNDNIEDK